MASPDVFTGSVIENLEQMVGRVLGEFCETMFDSDAKDADGAPYCEVPCLKKAVAFCHDCDASVCVKCNGFNHSGHTVTYFQPAVRA